MFETFKNISGEDIPVAIMSVERYAQYALKIIGSRWMTYIMYGLHLHQPMRFSAIKKLLPAQVTHKILSQQLGVLVKKGLVQRLDYNEKAPKVEYFLTNTGNKLIPIYDAITKNYMKNKNVYGFFSEANCPLEATIKIIRGKWKASILILLHLNGEMRYSRIKHALPSVTNKYLSVQLSSLESDGFIKRTPYLEMPPRVEYSLNGRGTEVLSMLEMVLVSVSEILPCLEKHSFSR